MEQKVKIWAGLPEPKTIVGKSIIVPIFNGKIEFVTFTKAKIYGREVWRFPSNI